MELREGHAPPICSLQESRITISAYGALKLVPKEGFEPSRITRSKRGSSASFLLSTSAFEIN